MDSVIVWIRKMLNIKQRHPQLYGLLDAILEIIVGLLAVAILGSIATFGLYWLGRLVHGYSWFYHQGEYVEYSTYCEVVWCAGLITLIALPMLLLVIVGLGSLGHKILGRRRY